ncbi:ABC transporter ATP-binding protein [Erysipelotrichaceae bacterium RD49]|nr:ABC transporter ATP-binding protein [Erysipelotrichaceae bacterium RD49]
MKNTPMIEVRHVTKEYPVGDERVIALDDINLTINKGEICCIFGPSGSGKSTLLNQLAGLEKPTRGGIRMDGTIISSLSESQLAQFRQNSLGFIFQAYNLLPSLTALENTAMPLMFQGMAKKKRNKAAAYMLKQVGLDNRMGHYPNQMSGGQQQRVGIARAFVSKPAIILADEPTGNLDSKSSKEVMDMIQDFAHRFHQTIVLVSHSPDAAQYADHVVHIFDGRIVKEEYRDPDSHQLVEVLHSPQKTACSASSIAASQ